MYCKKRKFSLHYRVERWFYSNHSKEIELIGAFIAGAGMFVALFFLPSIFH